MPNYSLSHSGHAHHCRRVDLHNYESASTQSPFRTFALPGDKPHYAPDRHYAVKHLFIDVALNFEQKSVSGRVLTTLEPVGGNVRQLIFDADGALKVSAVLLNESKLEFQHESGKLYVQLPEAVKSGQNLTVEVQYSVQPKKGLYFIAPEPEYPHKQTHAWTQGQDTDNHFWMPCYDAPNQKSTTEMRVVVPENFFALSNGALIDTQHDAAAKTKTYHWKQQIRHSSYLITLAAGPFVEIMDKWEDIPVPYYILPGREAEAKVSLSNTPQMVGFFSDKIGVRYPYEKYASVCVQDFIFGGMENTTATTLTEFTLQDERAHQDYSSDPLLAHELAHQWFGDLLTCRDWSHGWLNEGFATYFEALWTEHHLGRDEFVTEMYHNSLTYFGEDAGRYRRPIVCNVFHEPIDLFDRHLYEKGSLVLHMLRYLLGDEAWWSAINHYVTKHREQNVITADLERAVEEATGRNLQAFFEQWVYKAGYPIFKITSDWADATKTVKFTVVQTQPTDAENPLFTLPVEIAFGLENGQRETFKVELEEQTQTFYFRLPSRPKFASFDPANWILKRVDWTRSVEALAAQLEQDTEMYGRLQAAQALGKLGGLEAVAALQKALQNDGFWAVRAEAAAALGEIRTQNALNVLLAALPGEEHPKTRRAMATALGEFRQAEAAEALTKMLAGDKTDIVEGAAAAALGKTRQANAFDTLVSSLERNSFNQQVRIGAINGLVALKDERALEHVLTWTEYGKPDLARFGAIAALGTVGKLTKDRDRERVTDRLRDLLQDKNWRARISAIVATKTLGDDGLLPTLSRTVEMNDDGREVRLSREAITAIRAQSGQDAEVKKLREDLDRVLTENRELKDRLESLEQRLKG